MSNIQKFVVSVIVAIIIGVLVFFDVNHLHLFYYYSKEAKDKVPYLTGGWELTIYFTAITLFFLKFAIVEEGTARAVMLLGGFSRIIMKWDGYHFDAYGEVVPGWD